MQQAKTRRQFFTATRMATIALFGAMSGILYVFGFPMSFAFPSWLELNFSDIPALVGTFALGPVSGCIIIVVKILLKLIIKGTSTAFVGELADFIIGLAFVVPAGYIYKKRRTLKGAVLAMVVGSLSSTAVAVLANWLILVPFYANAYGMSTLVYLMQSLFNNCTEQTFYNYYLWVSVLPFNLMRCLIACLITFPIYKRISNVITRLGAKLDPPPKCEVTEEGEVCKTDKKRTVIIIAVTAAVLVVLAAAVVIRYFLF